MREIFQEPDQAAPPQFHALPCGDATVRAASLSLHIQHYCKICTARLQIPAAESPCIARLQETANAAWQAHAYIPYGNPAPGPGRVRNQIWLYGEPASLQHFCDLAQIANFVQYRWPPIIFSHAMV